MIDSVSMNDYITNRFGYGNLDAKYYLIGPEEGGDISLEQIEQGIADWESRGKQVVEDIRTPKGGKKWFQTGASLQRTWNGLIRIILSSEGFDHNRERVRSYQIDELGSTDGDTCLLELSPFPSKNVNSWRISNSEFPFLDSRKEFVKYAYHKRADRIRKLINDNSPEYVILYGSQYRKWWKQIAGVELKEEKFCERPLWLGISDKTTFVITQHPACYGVPWEYYHRIGKLISRKRI